MASQYHYSNTLALPSRMWLEWVTTTFLFYNTAACSISMAPDPNRLTSYLHFQGKAA
jgi:hypothetical protein